MPYTQIICNIYNNTSTICICMHAGKSSDPVARKNDNNGRIRLLNGYHGPVNEAGAAL